MTTKSEKSNKTSNSKRSSSSTPEEQRTQQLGDRSDNKTYQVGKNSRTTMGRGNIWNRIQPGPWLLYKCCTYTAAVVFDFTNRHKRISTSFFLLLPLASPYGEMTPLLFHFASSSGSCLPLLGYPFLHTYSYFVRGVCSFFSSFFYVFFLPLRVTKFRFSSAVNISGLHSGMSLLCLS